MRVLEAPEQEQNAMCKVLSYIIVCEALPNLFSITSLSC